MPEPQPGDYRITLRPQPSQVPAARRLALLLKIALRRLGFRCIEALEVPPAQPEKGEASDGRTDFD
jgi:hypothetical protein